MTKKEYVLVMPLQIFGGQKSEFTYHSDRIVPAGSLVKVPFGKQQKLGLVVGPADKPRFATKPITETLTNIGLPGALLKLALWMSEYYATPINRVLGTMMPAGLAAKRRQASSPTTYTQPSLKIGPLTLTAQQKLAVEGILNARKQFFLLHGATGSGKTRVYIELAKKAIERGKSVIVLVPEIALTAQIVNQFKAHFGQLVTVTHSAMTPAERRNTWLDIAATQPRVVIGPRSALFAPLELIGLIVIDESHETGYKQEQAPRYQAAAVGATLAKLHGAKLVLGSATPAVTDYYLASVGKLGLVQMPKRIHDNSLIKPEVIDLRDRKLLSNSSLISQTLLLALRDTISRGQQAILLLNRRGSARLALCQNCGWVSNCPRCQIPLTFHGDAGSLRCHWCGENQRPPARCPQCNQAQIVFLGGGSQRVESEVKKLLPEARIARLDRDTLEVKHLQAFFNRLENGEIDILVGTQMVAKGLDLPNVTTVGVILADTMLFIPDFTATERTFQLLHQVAGRGGRAHGAASQTIIQTYSPDHPVIQAVINDDYNSFVSRELAERRLLGYPPFVYLLKLSCSRGSRHLAAKAAEALADQLKAQANIQVVGPSPAWRETLRGRFHWQIIVKSKQRRNLIGIVQTLPANWTFDLDPIDLL